MTGNTVLLAIGVGTGKYADATRSALALAGFVAGAVLAALAGRGATTYQASDGSGRAAGFRLVLGAEFAVLVAATAWWLVGPTRPDGGTRLALIALLSLAMGAQSSAVTSLGVGVSTTYITGTWTAVSRRLAASRGDEQQTMGSSDGPPLQVAVLGCYFGCALAAGYLFSFAGAVAVVLPGVALAVVCGLSALR